MLHPNSTESYFSVEFVLPIMMDEKLSIRSLLSLFHTIPCEFYRT